LSGGAHAKAQNALKIRMDPAAHGGPGKQCGPPELSVAAQIWLLAQLPCVTPEPVQLGRPVGGGLLTQKSLLHICPVPQLFEQLRPQLSVPLHWPDWHDPLHEQVWPEHVPRGTLLVEQDEPEVALAATQRP
jgi:hypothetical protein